MSLLPLLHGCGGSEEETGPQREVESAVTKVERGPVRVTIEVTPKEARLSDEPILTLTIASKKGVAVRKPPFGESLGDFIIRDFHEPLPRVEDDRELVQQVYTLEPTRTGELRIHPITITFRDERPDGGGKEYTLETESLTIHVQSVVASEVPSLDDLEPLAGPIELPERRSGLWWWIIGAGGLLLGATVVTLWLLARRRPVPPEQRLSPRELAFLELKRLLERGLAEADAKLYYVELTALVRRYLERTTGIRAPEQTTEEFLRELGTRDTFPPGERTQLKSFLEAADLVKFAAYPAGKRELEESFRRAKIFIGLQQEEVTV